MRWYLDVLKKYAVFSGRARRKEFWMFILFDCIAVLILAILDNALGLKLGDDSSAGILTSFYSLAVFLPCLGVGIRRMHDIGKSGWWVLISLVPVVGEIWFIILAAKEGVKGDNQFGPDPKAVPQA